LVEKKGDGTEKKQKPKIYWTDVKAVQEYLDDNKKKFKAQA